MSVQQEGSWCEWALTGTCYRQCVWSRKEADVNESLQESVIDSACTAGRKPVWTSPNRNLLQTVSVEQEGSWCEQALTGNCYIQCVRSRKEASVNESWQEAVTDSVCGAGRKLVWTSPYRKLLQTVCVEQEGSRYLRSTCSIQTNTSLIDLQQSTSRHLSPLTLAVVVVGGGMWGGGAAAGSHSLLDSLPRLLFAFSLTWLSRLF